MWRLYVLSIIAAASAQIPSLGWCPDYLPMANFNVNRFLGTWYEAERYFAVSELVSRCVTTKYDSTPEGRIIVSNEITNSLTGLKRVLEGHLQVIGREGEGRFIVKYSSLPLPYDTEYSILETDYDNYAVMWSCSGIGPVHTQNAWILTRERLANLAIMQQAYAVLERYKISRTFFVKTNQADCTILPNPAAEPFEAKNAPVDAVTQNTEAVAEAVEKIDNQPIQKRIDPEVKPIEMVEEKSAVAQTPVERSAIPQTPEGTPAVPQQREDTTVVTQPRTGRMVVSQPRAGKTAFPQLSEEKLAVPQPIEEGSNVSQPPENFSRLKQVPEMILSESIEKIESPKKTPEEPMKEQNEGMKTETTEEKMKEVKKSSE